MPTSITKEALEAELQEAQSQLEHHKQETRRYERLIVALTQLLETMYEQIPKMPALGSSITTALAQFTLKEAIRLTLEKYDEPLAVRDILDELQSAGKRVGGGSPLETVRAVLYRYNKTLFYKNEDGRWTTRHQYVKSQFDQPTKEERAEQTGSG